jgi:hypothetical protein
MDMLERPVGYMDIMGGSMAMLGCPVGYMDIKEGPLPFVKSLFAHRKLVDAFYRVQDPNRLSELPVVSPIDEDAEGVAGYTIWQGIFKIPIDLDINVTWNILRNVLSRREKLT